MKKTVLLAIVAACGLFIAATPVSAQGTAFTYQGNLNSGGSPVTGLYDLTFEAYTVSSGGSQVGNTYTNLAVGVTNGLFTATVDFDGSAPFNGSTYYLQIGVRTNGVGSFQPLTPRQQITPTPYAITAENLDGTVLASQLTGSLPSGLLSGTYSDAVTLNNVGNTIDGSFSGSFSGSGTGLTGVALLGSANTFSVDQTIDGRLKVSDGSSAVSNFTDVIIGPGGYDPGEQHSVNFDDFAGHIGSLIVGYNGMGYFSVGNLFGSGTGGHQTNTTTFTVLGNGNVGIDTNNPQASLHVASTNGIGNPQLQLTQLTPGDYSRLRFAPNTNGIWDIAVGGGAADVMNFYNGKAAANIMTLTTNGLGIGTTAPAAPLHVVNTNLSNASAGIYGFSGGGSTADTDPGNGYYSAGGAFAGPNGVIGASAPGSTLGYGVIGFAAGSGGRGVYGYASSASGNVSGVYGESTSTSGYGVYGVSDSTSGTGVYAQGASQSSTALAIGQGAIQVVGAGVDTATAAFIHRAIPANISGDLTIITNAVCDGNPNAILIVTHNFNADTNLLTGSGQFNTNPIGVYYNASGHWGIYNENQATMLPGRAFNVLVLRP
jgi:hypothetical protein